MLNYGIVVDLVPEVRNISGIGAELLSDLRISRLLSFHDFDVLLTVEAVLKHVELKERFDGVIDSDIVENVTFSERFQYLGLNKDGCPVISINWMWGKFLDVPGGVDTLLEAFVAFQHRAVAQARLELDFPQAEPQLMVLSMGGGSEVSFVNKWLELGFVHYPQRIRATTLYPMDPESARAKAIRAALQSNLRSVQRQSKEPWTFLMAGSAAELATCLNVDKGFLPNHVVHCVPPTEEQLQATFEVRANLYAMPEVRKISGVSMEVLSDVRIRRLFCFHKFDVPATVEAVLKHVEFKEYFDSKVVSGTVEEVLLSERFQYLGLNKNRCPIISINWMWGQFPDVPGGADTLVEAYVIFQRRAVAQARLELGSPEAEPQLIQLSLSCGPPSPTFLNKWFEFGKVHFPESIDKTIIYPMDPEGPLAEMILADAHPTTGINRSSLASLSPLQFAGGTSQLATCLNVAEGFLPNELENKLRGPRTREQTRAVVKARTELFVQVSKEEHGYEVKHTFIKSKMEPKAPGLRRSNSDPGFAGDELEDKLPGLSCIGTIDTPTFQSMNLLGGLNLLEFVTPAPASLFDLVMPSVIGPQQQFPETCTVDDVAASMGCIIQEKFELTQAAQPSLQSVHLMAKAQLAEEAAKLVLAQAQVAEEAAKLVHLAARLMAEGQEAEKAAELVRQAAQLKTQVEEAEQAAKLVGDEESRTGGDANPVSVDNASCAASSTLWSQIWHDGSTQIGVRLRMLSPRSFHVSRTGEMDDGCALAIGCQSSSSGLANANDSSLHSPQHCDEANDSRLQSSSSMAASPRFSNKHTFHIDCKDICMVSSDMRMVTKVGAPKQVSLIAEAHILESLEQTYLVRFVGGTLSDSDGVGFIFSQTLPPPTKIKQITSLFVNQKGRICARMNSDLVKFHMTTQPLEIGDLISLSVDLERRRARFTIWSTSGAAPSQAIFDFDQSLRSSETNPNARREFFGEQSAGYLCCAVKNAGVSVQMLS